MDTESLFSQVGGEKIRQAGIKFGGFVGFPVAFLLLCVPVASRLWVMYFGRAITVLA